MASTTTPPPRPTAPAAAATASDLIVRPVVALTLTLPAATTVAPVICAVV